MARYGNRVPAAPLQTWLEDQLERLGADDTMRDNESTTSPPTTRILSRRLGITERALYRYRNGLIATTGGERSSDTYARPRVEIMLDHAGVHFWEVYPADVLEDLADTTGYCPRCYDDVPAIGGRCTACDGPVRDRRPRGSAPRTGQGRRITDAQVHAAHVLYQRHGLSLPKLGELLWRRLDYPSPSACESSLLRGFTVLGLPRRSQAEATALANRKHGRCADGGSHGAAYQRWWRAQRAARNPCAASGCPHPARPGEDSCGLHRPGFDEERAAYAAAGRAAQAARPPVVTPDLLRTAIALHHELRWDVTRIARELIGSTRVTGVDYLAKLLRDELRARGAYLGPRPERAETREAVAA